MDPHPLKLEFPQVSHTGRRKRDQPKENVSWKKISQFYLVSSPYRMRLKPKVTGRQEDYTLARTTWCGSFNQLTEVELLNLDWDTGCDPYVQHQPLSPGHKHHLIIDSPASRTRSASDLLAGPFRLKGTLGFACGWGWATQMEQGPINRK